MDESALDADEGLKVLNMELSTADGGTVTIERESGEPQVGDKAQPDGEFELPDGRVLVIEDGVIVEIKGADEDAEDAADDVDELQALKDENEQLRNQLEEAKKMAKTREDLRILNAVKMAGGEDALRKFASGYAPQTRKHDGKDAAERAEERAESPMRKEIMARQKGEWRKE